MKRFISSLCLAGVLAGAVGTIGSYAAPSMSISVVAPKSAISVTSTRPVSVTVKVSGLKLNVHRIGKKPVAGQGHIQIYLDKIPSGAYGKGNSQNLIVVVGSKSFSFQVSKKWTTLHKGKHHFVLALAKNNNILYHAPTASIAVTVK